MPLKDISYLWQHLHSFEQNHLCNFGRRHHEEKLCEMVLNLKRGLNLNSVQEMSFKGISYLELWRSFCSAERNHLCNFGRGYYEEQF